MTKKALAVIIIVLILISYKMAYAGDADNAIIAGSAIKFSAGIVSAFLIHEGAHAVVGEVTDTNMNWKLGNYNQPIAFTENADSDAKGVAVYSAGLLSQAIGSEIVLQTDKIDKNDNFVRGYMAWNIINPILYALDYWFFGISNKTNGNTYQGDIAGIEHYSDKSTANAFAFSMAGIATFQGYRYLKTQPWAPKWLKNKSHSINFTPESSGGFFMAYQYHF